MNKIETVQNFMLDAKIPLVAVTAGPDLRYLTGLDFHISERPAILLLAVQGPPHLIHPELEAVKVKGCKFPLISFPYGESKETWASVCAQALNALPGDKIKIGVISTQMRYLEMELIHRAGPELRFVTVDKYIQEMRKQKEVGEIASIRKAVEIAERAFLETIRIIEPGRTEKEIAAALVLNLFNSGSDPELPFSPIVASGPNSADPHAVPTERVVEVGDLIVIDWGAACSHYISDITRTISIGSPSAEFEQIARIVSAANTAAREKAGEQVLCSEVDAAARAVITAADYGEYFTHRTGHGIGLEAHEAPYISAEDQYPLKIGNTFTIEPGIYLPGRGGVRIEDNVAITEQGAETLTSLPRELFIID
jgi:Xaa-Pro dipeptidase